MPNDRLKKRLKELYGREETQVEAGDIRMVPDPEMIPEPRLRDAIQGAPVVKNARDLGGPMNPGLGDEYGPEAPPKMEARQLSPEEAARIFPGNPAPAPPPPSDQAEHEAYLRGERPKPSFSDLADEEGDAEPVPARPGLLDALKERFAGTVNQLGPIKPGKMAGAAAKTVKPPLQVDWSKAAAKVVPPLSKPEGEWPDVKEPDQPTSGMYDEPLGPEAPIGPAYNPDLLAEEPTAQDQMPDQAQVPNEQLAQAVNATSAVSNNQDAVKAMQREHSPRDESAYYAALKTVANASGRNAHGVGYYDAKIAEQKQAQKDWQTRLSQELTAKYQTDQMREKQREFDLKQEENRLRAEEQANYRVALLENRKGAQDAIQARFNENKVQQVLKEIPEPRVVDAFKRLRKRLMDPREIQGWDSAKSIDKFGRVQGLFSPLGIPFQIMGEEFRKGTEAEGMMQDAMAIFQGVQLDASGKVINEQEMKNIERRLGLAAGQSQAAFRKALENELAAKIAGVDLHFRSQSPEVQAELEKRKMRPDFSPADETHYAPYVNWHAPASEDLKKQPQSNLKASSKAAGGDALHNWLKDSFSVKDAVDNAKAQEDEEERKRRRPD